MCPFPFPEALQILRQSMHRSPHSSHPSRRGLYFSASSTADSSLSLFRLPLRQAPSDSSFLLECCPTPPYSCGRPANYTFSLPRQLVLYIALFSPFAVLFSYGRSKWATTGAVSIMSRICRTLQSHSLKCRELIVWLLPSRMDPYFVLTRTSSGMMFRMVRSHSCTGDSAHIFLSKDQWTETLLQHSSFLGSL